MMGGAFLQCIMVYAIAGYKPVFCVGDPSPHEGNWKKIDDTLKIQTTRFGVDTADSTSTTATTTKNTKIM